MTGVQTCALPIFVLWRSLAEVAEKTIKKGALVYVIGKIKTRSYVDKDGNNKYITEILADALLLLDKKQGAGAPVPQTEINSNEGSDRESPGSEVNDPPANYQANSEDDLPF